MRARSILDLLAMVWCNQECMIINSKISPEGRAIVQKIKDNVAISVFKL